MRFILHGILGLSLLSFTFWASAQLRSENKEGKTGLECRYLYSIEQGFLTYHVRYSNRDAELQNRVLEQHIKHLDPTKIYLLESDIAQIKKIMSNVLELTKDKNCGFLTETEKILLERVKQRAEFAKKFLGKDYKFDAKTEFVYDPEKKAWAKTDQEANDFLKKYVHFQVANYLATDLKLEEAKSRVIKNYDRMVKRTTDTTMDELYAGYLDSFARALDPHSSFFSKDYFEDFNIQMSLSLEGIGATLSSEDGFTKVENLVPGGAAARSGQIEPNDKIIAVGQETGLMENVIDMDLKDVVKKIRGKKGSKVRLTIMRSQGGAKKKFDVALVRDKVNLEDEAASIIYIDKEVNGQKKKIGVINFPSFYADSHRGGRSSSDDLKKLVKEAREKKADGLVLDLSTNGGGSLEDAVKIAGLFFKTGNVVKQSSKLESKGEATLADIDSTVDWPGPLVLLTSRISASASEIVSGTLQDYKRAVIVGGDHTFGKGTVQSVMPLYDLGAIKVTVGMFFVAGGNSTQHRGVEADVVLPSAYSADDVGEKFLDYSLPPKKIDAFLSPEAYVKEGDSAWQMIKPEWVKVLKEKSQARVEKSADFKKITDESTKAKERGKLIRVSEIVKDKEKNEKEKKAKQNKYGKKEERNKEYLKRADIQEAASVLTDLILIEEGKAPGPQAKKE